MDSPIGKLVAKGTDCGINPFVMLETKCEMIECSHIMLMGAHNRCSFEVTLKVNNRHFIANGPTLLSAKKKASLVALREMHNEGNKIVKKTSSKALDFGESNVETEMLVHNLRGSDMQEAVSITTPQEHFSNSNQVDPQKIITTTVSTDHSKNDKNAELSTNEPNPIISSRCFGYRNMDETCVIDLDDDFQDSNVCGGEDDIRLLPIQQHLENVEDVTLPTAELLKTNANDSIPSIKMVSDVKEYTISIKNSYGSFQHKEELCIDKILNEEPIVDVLESEPSKAFVADDTEFLEETKNTINAKETVKTPENIPDNREHELSAYALDSDSLPNLNVVDTSVNNIVDSEKNNLTIFEPVSSSGHRYDLCTGGPSSVEKLSQSANTTYLNKASKSQDILKEDEESNSGDFKETTRNTDENNKDEDGNLMTVQEGELVSSYLDKSPSDELFTSRSSSILKAPNYTEVAQETESPTKLKTEIFKEDCNGEINNEPVIETNENQEKSEKGLNPKVFATEILEEYTKLSTLIQPDNELHDSDNEEENIHSTLNSKKTCRESPLKEYPLGVAVAIPEKNDNNHTGLEIYKAVDSRNVNETNKVIIVNNAGSSNDKTIQDLTAIQEQHSKNNIKVDKAFDATCEPEINSLLLSKEYNSQKNLEINIDTDVESLKETDDNNIYENTKRTTTSNLKISEEYDNPKDNLGNTLPFIDAVTPKEKIAVNVLSVNETDLKIYENSTVAKTDRETIYNLQTGKESDITLGFKENSVPLIEEALLKGTSLSNYKMCMAGALIKQEPNIIIDNDCSTYSSPETMNAEMDKDSDLYQTNESIILPSLDLDNSVDLPITINKHSVPNPFAKKPIGSNKASEGSAKKRALQKNNINLLKVNKKTCNVSVVEVGVQSSLVKDKESNKCILNPFVKKMQTPSSTNIATLKRNSNNNLQDNIVVVDLIEERGAKPSIATKPATKLLALKRKRGKETLTNPVSKKIKLDIISHTNEASSTQVSSKVIQLDESTVGINSKREETINHCLSILLNDDEQITDFEGAVPAVLKEIDSKKDGNNLNARCVKTTKIGKLQSSFLNRNPINFNDGVLKDPVISKNKPQTFQFPITPKTKPPTSQFKKPKTPAKKFVPKLKGKSSDIKPRFHPYRQRYLQELATKRQSSRSNNKIGDPIERLSAICPGIRYKLESEMGPPHAPFVILSATMNGRNFYGHGKTRRLASLDAAEQILDTLHSGSTPKIEPINSKQKEQLSACGNHNNKRVVGSEFDQNNNQQQVQPTNIPMANQTKKNNNNNVPLPQCRRVLDRHSNSHNILGKYVSPLPPRDKRIANVLPNKHQYVDQCSNNSDLSGFLQSLQMQMQCGTQGYNFDTGLSRSVNFHFPGQSSNRNVYNNHQFDIFERTPYPQYNFFSHVIPNYSENFYNGSPQFNSSELSYMQDNIPNSSMSNNYQFSGHNRIQQHSRGANRWSRNKRNNNHYENDESMLMSNNQRQVNISADNTAPQPPRPRSQCINPEPPTYLIPNDLQKSLHLPMRDADIMEQLILERFKQLTESRPEVSNYKVLAGIVMTRHLNFQNAKVIAVATGTKCINGGNISSQGTVINDSHAEVIARRCLMKFLYTQLKYHCRSDNAQESIFVRNPTGFKYSFTLKSQVQFHLYISTAPCGDARVFSSSDDCNNHHILNNHGQLRTKVEGDMGTNRIGNQYLRQTWDGIQIGDPLHTMSCSDKIARWNVLGIQGGLLATLTEPIYLSSIVLGSMFSSRHLYRAVCGRLEQSLNFLPGHFRLNRPLLGQTSKTRMRRSTENTPRIGVNWTFGDNDIEIISLAAGREITNKTSYLCKKIFFQKFLCLVRNIPNLDFTQMPNIYAEVKLIAGDYQMAKQVLFDAFQHAELGCWVKKPVEQNEFAESC